MTRGTSDRLRSEMDEEAQRLRRLAAGYRMAGEGDLARSATIAAHDVERALQSIGLHMDCTVRTLAKEN